MNIPFGITTFCGNTIVNMRTLCSSEDANEIRKQYPDLVIWQARNADCYRFQGYIGGFNEVSRFMNALKIASNNVKIARLQNENSVLQAPPTHGIDPFEWDIADPDELPF